mmetsp:Transcript_7782/g.16907  ORF Transcript_7782/g.16907 Transcript_7782/m.16907 type:complete len:118 (-) Transcript_7782:637-990(-)
MYGTLYALCYGTCTMVHACCICCAVWIWFCVVCIVVIAGIHVSFTSLIVMVVLVVLGLWSYLHVVVVLWVVAWVASGFLDTIRAQLTWLGRIILFITLMLSPIVFSWSVGRNQKHIA